MICNPIDVIQFRRIKTLFVSSYTRNCLPRWGYMLQYLQYCFTCTAVKLCHSSFITLYGKVIMEQFMGLTYSDKKETTWKASPQTAAAHSQIDADRRKIYFPREKVSSVNLLSLHSLVNYLGAFNSRAQTNGVTSFSNTTATAEKGEWELWTLWARTSIQEGASVFYLV